MSLTVCIRNTNKNTLYNRNAIKPHYMSKFHRSLYLCTASGTPNSLGSIYSSSAALSRFLNWCNKAALCEQISPLAVPLYSFGYPKQYLGSIYSSSAALSRFLNWCNKAALCEQISPLAVPLYSFGYPKQYLGSIYSSSAALSRFLNWCNKAALYEQISPLDVLMYLT